MTDQNTPATKVTPVAMNSEAVTGAMCTSIINKLKEHMLSEAPGFTTELKRALADLPDSQLQVLSLLDLIGSPYITDLPCSFGSYVPCDLASGLSHETTVSQLCAVANQFLPIPISLYTTIALDAERLIAFLDLPDSSPITTRSIIMMCAHCALRNSVGESQLTTMNALGYIVECNGFKCMIIGSSKDEHESVGHFPFEFSKDNRRKLRRALYCMQVETSEKLGTGDTSTNIYYRLVPLSLTDANCRSDEMLGICYNSYNAIKDIAGAPHASRGRKFVGRFLTEIFSCFFRPLEKPFPNIFYLVSRSQSDYVAAKDIIKGAKLPSAKKARMA